MRRKITKNRGKWRAEIKSKKKLILYVKLHFDRRKTNPKKEVNSFVIGLTHSILSFRHIYAKVYYKISKFAT